MTTYQHLLNFVNAKGNTYELNPKTRKYWNLDGEETMVVGHYFGIRNLAGRKSSEWCWTWFETYDEVVTPESNFYFVERYSMNTGKSNTGWRESYAAHHAIEAFNGIDY